MEEGKETVSTYKSTYTDMYMCVYTSNKSIEETCTLKHSYSLTGYIYFKQ